jgi:hypothetical protein
MNVNKDVPMNNHNVHTWQAEKMGSLADRSAASITRDFKYHQLSSSFNLSPDPKGK